MIDGIVLAGGTSRRFGGDKLEAELDGTSLLARSIAAVEAVADRVVVAGPALPNGIRASNTPIVLVPDPVPACGPLVALAGALEALTPTDPAGSLAIVVGGDMPGLVAAVLRAMLNRLASAPAVDAVDALVLAAPAAERRQVLPMALRVAPARRAAAALARREDRSLRALLELLPTAELPEDVWRALDPTGDTLADVDTRDDLERLRAGRVGQVGS